MKTLCIEGRRATSGASACAESPCKIVSPQCGCGSGEQCTVGEPTEEAPNGRFCVTAGDVAIGEPCNANAECAEGAKCVNIGGVTACLEFCANDTSCDAPGGICVITLEDAMGAVIPDATLCSIDCDPLTNNGCTQIPNAGCIIGKDTATGKPFSICAATGNGMQGSPCTTTADCAPTFSCNGAAPNQQCLQYCGFSPAIPGCPGGTVCTAFNPKLVLGPQEYGACL